MGSTGLDLGACGGLVVALGPGPWEEGRLAVQARQVIMRKPFAFTVE